MAGRERALAMMGLILGLPGSPYIFQGSELAAEQVSVPPEFRQDPIWDRSGHTREGRDGCRTPLPWSSEGPGFGFTAGTAGWLPFASDADVINVETQQLDPRSPWSVLAALLATRRTLLPLLGDTVEEHQSPEGVLLLERAGGLLLMLNTADSAVEIRVGAGEIVGSTSPVTLADETLTLAARSTAWFRLRPGRR